MFTRSVLLVGVFLMALQPLNAAAAPSTDADFWQPEKGDVFVVDVPANEGYLIHPDGRTVGFPVATGRKGYVHYIGRTYKADTPIRTWVAKEEVIKGDRRTFGVGGRFLRLFRNGEESPYGIHSYHRVDEWMEENQRYFSMGCIVVTEDMLDVIEKTFTFNDRSLTVITTDNLQSTLQKVSTVAKQLIESEKSVAVGQ